MSETRIWIERSTTSVISILDNSGIYSWKKIIFFFIFFF
jgi:hypothetical protein